MFLLEAINMFWRVRCFLWPFLLSPLYWKLAITASCSYNRLGKGEFWSASSGMIKSNDNVLRRKWHNFWQCKWEWWKTHRLRTSVQLKESFHMLYMQWLWIFKLSLDSWVVLEYLLFHFNFFPSKKGLLDTSRVFLKLLHNLFLWTLFRFSFIIFLFIHRTKIA